MKKYNVAIVGATGVVGTTFLKVLEEYDFPINELHLFASEKSFGMEILFKGEKHFIKCLDQNSFNNIDFALFSAGANISLKWAPIAEAAGAIVIDNSKAFRMNDECSLIVPEININDYKSKRKIIANPNCSTIQSVLPLNALKKYGIERVIYTTYQAVSGSGSKGINDYENTKNGGEASFYPYNISRTCIPHIDSFLDNGYTKEEMKMIEETRKILHLPNLMVTATCVRVPILMSHAVSVIVELEQEFELDEIRKDFASQEGIILLDNPKENIYPTAIHSTGNDKVYVGRIRRDLSNPKALMFYCVADNIRKGAASNAVMIAKKIIEE